MYNVVFESKRMYFVNVEESLVNDYLAMVNDKEVQKFLSHEEKVYTLEKELAWINKKLEEKELIFSMIEKETSEFIGNIEIMSITNNIGLLGIAITRKKQDRHFGQEALARMIDFAYNTLNLDGLELNAHGDNYRAIHCYLKVGFVKTGVGDTPDDIHMRLIRG